jgi:hypothetical protein
LSPDKRLSTLGCFLVCGILWNRTTRFLQQRFYRPLITPVTEASQLNLFYSTLTGNRLYFLPYRTRTYDLPAPAGCSTNCNLRLNKFVPPDRIELSPFACKTNTLPLRQRGRCSSFRAVQQGYSYALLRTLLCFLSRTPGWPRTSYPSVKSGVPVHMSFEGKNLILRLQYVAL